MPYVVYFDQLMGALQLVYWSKYAFLDMFMFFYLFCIILRQKGKNEAKKKKARKTDFLQKRVDS